MTTTLTRSDIEKISGGDVKITRAIEELFRRITVAEDGVASGADTTTGIDNATVITLSANDAFGNERILAVVPPLAIQDNGPGGTVVVGFNRDFDMVGLGALTLVLQADSTLTLPTSGLLASQPFPGPYATDAAAASAGVPVGFVYRVSDGTVKWRQA